MARRGEDMASAANIAKHTTYQEVYENNIYWLYWIAKNYFQIELFYFLISDEHRSAITVETLFDTLNVHSMDVTYLQYTMCT